MAVLTLPTECKPVLGRGEGVSHGGELLPMTVKQTATFRWNGATYAETWYVVEVGEKW